MGVVGVLVFWWRSVRFCSGFCVLLIMFRNCWMVWMSCWVGWSWLRLCSVIGLVVLKGWKFSLMCVMWMVVCWICCGCLLCVWIW